jgi:hypothetical protein
MAKKIVKNDNKRKYVPRIADARLKWKVESHYIEQDKMLFENDGEANKYGILQDITYTIAGKWEGRGKNFSDRMDIAAGKLRAYIAGNGRLNKFEIKYLKSISAKIKGELKTVSDVKPEYLLFKSDSRRKAGSLSDILKTYKPKNSKTKKIENRRKSELEDKANLEHASSLLTKIPNTPHAITQNRPDTDISISPQLEPDYTDSPRNFGASPDEITFLPNSEKQESGRFGKWLKGIFATTVIAGVVGLYSCFPTNKVEQAPLYSSLQTDANKSMPRSSSVLGLPVEANAISAPRGFRLKEDIAKEITPVKANAISAPRGFRLKEEPKIIESSVSPGLVIAPQETVISRDLPKYDKLEEARKLMDIPSVRKFNGSILNLNTTDRVSRGNEVRGLNYPKTGSFITLVDRLSSLFRPKEKVSSTEFENFAKKHDISPDYVADIEKSREVTKYDRFAGIVRLYEESGNRASVFLDEEGNWKVYTPIQ